MEHPNITKLAVVAAGGTNKVAAEFNVTAVTVSSWIRNNKLPVNYVDKICRLGYNIFTPDQLLSEEE